MKADCPLSFINSVVNEFQNGKEYGDESFIIPTSLFEIAKSFMFVEISHCELNEIKSKILSPAILSEWRQREKLEICDRYFL